MNQLLYVADPMCSWCWGFAGFLPTNPNLGSIDDVDTGDSGGTTIVNIDVVEIILEDTDEALERQEMMDRIVEHVLDEIAG